MKIKYFEDTDIALLESPEHPLFETKKIMKIFIWTWMKMEI
jgi:uncharacterized protein YuzE